MMVVIALIGSGGFLAYYHYADNGAVNQVLSDVAKYYSKVLIPSSVSSEVTFVPPSSSSSAIAGGKVEENESYLDRQENLVKVAIGLDFFSQSLEGKIFRIIQYLTQLLIVVGAVYLLVRHLRYKFTAEFVAGIGCSFLLLFACVFIPNFSNIINMSRFYQISLFFLAPMFVLGVDALCSIKKKENAQ